MNQRDIYTRMVSRPTSEFFYFSITMAFNHVQGVSTASYWSFVFFFLSEWKGEG